MDFMRILDLNQKREGKAMKFLKGMCAGLMVGACIGMVLAPESKSYKRKIDRAMRSVGSRLEELGDMLGM